MADDYVLVQTMTVPNRNGDSFVTDNTFYPRDQVLAAITNYFANEPFGAPLSVDGKIVRSVKAATDALKDAGEALREIVDDSL